MKHLIFKVLSVTKIENEFEIITGERFDITLENKENGNIKIINVQADSVKDYPINGTVLQFGDK